MPDSTLIRVPASRAKQLRALARVRNTTMAGLIDELITRGILAKEIPDETPGLTLTIVGMGHLAVEIQSLRHVIYVNEVEALFSWLGAKTLDKKTKRIFGNHFSSLEVRKAGTAIVIEIRKDRKRPVHFAVTKSIAEDLRRQLIAAYEKIEKIFRPNFRT